MLLLHFCVEMAPQRARACCLGGKAYLHGEEPSGGAVVPQVSTAFHLGFCPRTYNDMKRAGEGGDSYFIAPDIALFFP